uniref:Uncharacterized protein n=1 Tax=Anolis carolinensis TaxID=28377 RepID=A0A803SQX4_ANOCA
MVGLVLKGLFYKMWIQASPQCSQGPVLVQVLIFLPLDSQASWKIPYYWQIINKSSPYAAVLAAQDVAPRRKELGITALHIKLRATGGNRTNTPGPGTQSALRALARPGMKIGHSTRRKGGRRGHHL